MNIHNLLVTQWPDDRVRKYLDQHNPGENIEWIVLDESGLYGYTDSAGMQFACADDDEHRAASIIQFLIRNGGSYISKV